MSEPHTPTVAIIGGGIAGLSAAWEVWRAAGPGVQIVALEAGHRWVAAVVRG